MAGMTNFVNCLWQISIVTHRYLGVSLSFLMVMWFVSGIVMMYVRFPHVTEDQRIRVLAPISWTACCRFGDQLIADDEFVSHVQIEGVTDATVMLLRRVGRPQMIINLQQGTILRVDAARAEAIARDASLRVIGQTVSPISAEQTHTDQWTIGLADPHSSFFRFVFNDPERTNIYVSGPTGQVVLWTTKTQRFWNWFGAIPHWMYFVDLRRNTELWSDVLIGTSMLGMFLTLIGLYVGIVHFKCGVGRAASPYCGAFYWHHVAGLMFGLVTLTWLLSGLISMNPWGFLESGQGADEKARIAGQPIKWGEVRASIEKVRTRYDVENAVSLVMAPLDGHLYWRATQIDGKTIRLDATGGAAPFTNADLARAAQKIAETVGIANQSMLYEEDAYNFQGRDGFALPVYRVILSDEGRTRYYLDPATGSLLQRVDSNSRWHRWLFGGLHRVDFVRWMRARPVWDIIVLVILSGGLTLTSTGLYLAVRRVRNDAVALLRFVPKRGTARHAPPSSGDTIDV